MKRLILDRYLLREWVRILVLTALGFPLVVITFGLTDNLDEHLARKVPPKAIALGYAHSLPENIFMTLPAAVLFATVFSLGSLSRHSELTAAKASGRSVRRTVVPVLAAATLTSGGGPGAGGVGPGGHHPLDGVPGGARGAVHQLALQLRLPRRRGLGVRRAGARPARQHDAGPHPRARGPGPRVSHAGGAEPGGAVRHVHRPVEPAQRAPRRRPRHRPELRVRVRLAPPAEPRRDAGRPPGGAQGAARDALRRAGAVHRRHRALGRRRPQAAGAPGAQDRGPVHLRRDRHLRGAARAHGTARERRRGRRHQPRHHHPVPAAGAALGGGGSGRPAPAWWWPPGCRTSCSP
jgi:hypothetical protein